MQPFTYRRASDAPQAAAFVEPGSRPPVGAPSQFIAGGTQMLDLMKLNVMRPETLIDINDLARAHSAIELRPDGLHLGALVRMSQAAAHEGVRRDYPVVAETLALAASAQLRNMATLGGNVLQRTRCEYFRDAGESRCNKRAPGSGCAALEGVHRKHAVLGVSDSCIAAYGGDFAQALVALGASVAIQGRRGARSLAFEALHTGSDEPHIETQLAADEIITGFIVPAGPWTRRSTYVKVRDRDSYAYGVATAAVALALEDGVVREARIGLGAVSYKPWRPHAVEAALKNKRLDETTANDAAALAFEGARPRKDNAFMVDLGRRTIVRALMQAAAMEA